MVEFAAALYGDKGFLRALYNALSEDGILITQVGEAPIVYSAPEDRTVDRNRRIYSDTMVALGFQNILDYQEVSFFVVLCQLNRFRNLLT